MSNRIWFVVIPLLVSLTTNATAAPKCPASNARQFDVNIDVGNVQRPDIPRELFGFNVVWPYFQGSLFANGVVRPEVISYLRPFAGALYRYPGGSPSNWFEWQKSIGDVADRTPQFAEFGMQATVAFGHNEFLNFVRQVDGRALLTLNIAGPYKQKWTLEQLSANTRNFVHWLNTESVAKCAGGPQCLVKYLELGNELDLPPFRWTGTEYAARANAAITSIPANDSATAIQWVVHMRSAPWGSGAPEGEKRFDQEAATKAVTPAFKLAAHPYYDGNSIPFARQLIDAQRKTWEAAQRKPMQVLVTEHARWPSMPTIGQWKDNWYQGTSLGGAISSADFLIAAIPDPNIIGANWHALATAGPWQLLRRNKRTDLIYPSPVYWGFRVLRDAMFEDALFVSPTQLSDPAAYAGGYAVRIAATRNQGGDISVLGVNRSNDPIEMNLNWRGGTRIDSSAQFRWITSAATADDNTDDDPNRVVMNRETVPVSSGRSQSTWCIPPRSVFSISER